MGMAWWLLFYLRTFIGPQIPGRLKHRCLLFCQKQLAILHTSWLVVLPLFLMFWLHLNVFFNFSAVKKDFSSFWLVFIPCFFVVTNFDSFYNFWSGFPSLDQNIHLCMMAQSRALPMWTIKLWVKLRCTISPKDFHHLVWSCSLPISVTYHGYW